MPSILFRRLVQRWYVLIFAMILGGLVGLVMTFVRAPVYEGTASIHATLDPNRSFPISTLRRTQAMDQVRVEILSDNTLQSVLEAIGSDQDRYPSIKSPGELRASVRLGRSETGFTLSVFGPDPQWVADVANAWARASVDVLEEASIHAIKAAEMQTLIYQLGCELELVGEGEEKQQAVWACGSDPGDREAEDLPPALVDEVMKSRGIVPALTFSLAQAAEPPTQPIRWANGGLILAGVSAGLLIGILAVMLADKARAAVDIGN